MLPNELQEALNHPEKAPKGHSSGQPNDKGETWPSWRYGPNGQSMICQGPKDVPKGWKDTPSAFAEAKEAPSHDL